MLIYSNINKNEIYQVTKKRIEKFEKDIPEILGEELIDKQEIKKVVWGEKEIQVEKIKIGKYEIPVTILWLLVGIMLWWITENFIWFTLGLCFGCSTGYAVKKSEEKITVKKDKDKK